MPEADSFNFSRCGLGLVDRYGHANAPKPTALILVAAGCHRQLGAGRADPEADNLSFIGCGES